MTYRTVAWLWDICHPLHCRCPRHLLLVPLKIVEEILSSMGVLIPINEDKSLLVEGGQPATNC